MITRQTSLSANIVAFCRHLRLNDFTIGPSEEQDALAAIQLIDPFQSPEQLELCLQTALCRTPRQLSIFPKLYKNYWRELNRALDSKISDEETEKVKSKPKQQPKKAPSLQSLKDWLYGNKNKELVETAIYSAEGTGSKGDQVVFQQQELKEVFQLVQKLVKKIANRRSRRFRTDKKRGKLDIQKSIRKNIVKHGEIVQILYKKKKKDNVKVVLLCDVSRSMELYSRFFIQFMYAFNSLFPKVESFAFSTSLHHISKDLNQTSIETALEKVINNTPHWSGGTQIGTSLAQFNQQFAHKYLNSKTLVIILSDGWDTDEVDKVNENMKLIHRKALKVLWLNPLAGSTDWQPEVRGMKAAMPYIDALLPLYNIESLRRFVNKLDFKSFRSA